MYIYYDNRGRVKFLSEEYMQGFGNLNFEEVDLTADQTEKIKRNYLIRYKNDKIELEKPPRVIKEEKKEAKKQTKQLLAEMEKKETLDPHLKQVITILLNDLQNG